MLIILYLVALGNHCFLSEENLFRRDLNTEISSGNHDAIRGFDNFIQIVHTLMIFDFRDDENVSTFLT